MPTKGIITNFPAQQEYIQESVEVYIRLLSNGRKPTVNDLLNVTAPDGFSPCPQKKWHRPWLCHKEPEKRSSSDNKDTVIKLVAPPSSDTANTADEEGLPGDTLLGYRWNCKTDAISTNKSPWLNIHPARRGRRPAWARIHEANDLLKIHKLKPLRQRQALSAAHALFDPNNTFPFVLAMLKYVYRYLILSSPAGSTYETELSDEFVKHHLLPAVSAVLTVKKMTQHRTWRLPVAVDYSKVRFEIDTLSDGCWGVTAGAACIVYLLQRYLWDGEKRTKIFLYAAQVGLNPMSRLIHQVDSELQGFNIAAKETKKAIAALRNDGIAFTAGQVRMTSDSQTGLSLCCKASLQLDMTAGLIVSRVQETFGNDGLFHAPGQLFSGNVDLLTRYDPGLLSKIQADPDEFYSPKFLHPEVPDRVTVPVEKMKKDLALPHLCQKMHVWCQVADGLPPNLLEVAEARDPMSEHKGFNSTGRGPLQRTQKCSQPCLTCGTSKVEEAHPKDQMILREAQNKTKTKTKTKKAVPNLLAAAGISGFKSHKPRHTSRSARSGLVDKRPLQDLNVWKTLLNKRRGYSFTVRVIKRCLAFIKGCRKGSGGGQDNLDAHQTALRLLFQAERSNSFKAAETRRGYHGFELVEDQGILFIQGRSIDPGTEEEPSILKQDNHILISEKQEAGYMVPLMAGHTALAKATMEEIHDEFHGDSPASANARYSRYFYTASGSLAYFRQLKQKCFSCRRVNARRGKDVISQMRRIHKDDMQEGISVMVDVAGPWLVHLNPNQVDRAATRSARRTRVKRWALLAICTFSHRIEVAELDSMSTGSLMTTLAEIQRANGWVVKRLALDPGSSLLPAAVDTARHFQQEEDNNEQAELEDNKNDSAPLLTPEESTELPPQEAAALLAGLKEQGITIRTPFTKASWRQGQIESSIKTFKRTLAASLMPGTSSPLTVCSFGRCIRMSANMMNLRPIVLLPSDPANSEPGELLLASPTSLRGPSNCAWMPLAAGRDYKGQAALIQQQQIKFRANHVKHTVRRMRSNSRMETSGPGWGIGSVVLITDMAGRGGRDHPYPRLARITAWMDPKTKSQALLSNGVNRPVGHLTLLVAANEQIDTGGKVIDEQVQADQEAFDLINNGLEDGASPSPPGAPPPPLPEASAGLPFASRSASPSPPEGTPYSPPEQQVMAPAPAAPAPEQQQEQQQEQERGHGAPLRRSLRQRRPPPRFRP